MAIDEEIRAVLTQVEPSLEPFYGMMLTLFLSPDANSPTVRRQLRAGKLAA